MKFPVQRLLGEALLLQPWRELGHTIGRALALTLQVIDAQDPTGRHALHAALQRRSGCIAGAWSARRPAAPRQCTSAKLRSSAGTLAARSISRACLPRPETHSSFMQDSAA